MRDKSPSPSSTVIRNRRFPIDFRAHSHSLRRRIIPGIGSEASVWTAKDAYRACGPMLKALGTEESNPPDCSTLHMCANEAPLDDAEMAELYKLIERTPGCEPP